MLLKIVLKKIKKDLEKEKKKIETDLNNFAVKDKETREHWNIKFPKFDIETTPTLEEEADETEEYATLLPIEISLEERLKDINTALKKIENNQYGKCEKCAKNISINRLIICPEAKFCLKCKK